MPDQLKHPAHLLIASLVQQHFVPRVGLRLVQHLDLCRRGASAVFECDAAPQSLNPAIRRHTFNFHFVNFLDAVASGRDVVCEVAVIGEQQQTFSVEVETSNRMNLAERRRSQFGD